MNTPEGWKLVPVESTYEMRTAMNNACGPHSTSYAAEQWDAAFAAAPTPPDSGCGITEEWELPTIPPEVEHVAMLEKRCADLNTENDRLLVELGKRSTPPEVELVYLVYSGDVWWQTNEHVWNNALPKYRRMAYTSPPSPADVEPVGWLYRRDGNQCISVNKHFKGNETPVYTSPPSAADVEPVGATYKDFSAKSPTKALIYEGTDLPIGTLLYTSLPSSADQPIPMILHCPACGMQHIDAPESDGAYTERLHESSWWELGGDKPERWSNPPHRSHLCHGCGHIWRPADVATEGVEGIYTRGKRDSMPVKPVDDELRKVAEEAYEVLYELYHPEIGSIELTPAANVLLDKLRAALNKGKS